MGFIGRVTGGARGLFSRVMVGSPHFLAWLTDRQQPRRSVLLMGAIGCILASTLVVWYWAACRMTHAGYNPLLCRVIAESPPWALLAGIATLPGVALGWYWRTDFKNHELNGAEEKARAEGFVKYAEMLGQDKGPSQLGGIHGLKHLGIEDAKRKSLVVDVLCSFVRSWASRDFEAEMHAHPTTGELPSPPSLAVATAIEALSILKASDADLRGVDLDNLAVDKVAITNANFTEARLVDAQLPRANLSHGRFDDANCAGAKLAGANLVGASFVRAHLWGTVLIGADLTGADMDHAVLTQANLREATMKGARFYSAKLDGAFLPQADLRSANLNRADLQGANLQDANLSGADLQGANLEGANLEGAILLGADLDGAKLAGANVTRRQLARTQGEPHDAPLALVGDGDEE